jgi:hypothetical protein
VGVQVSSDHVAVGFCRSLVCFSVVSLFCVFSVVLVVDLYGGLARGRVAFSRAIIVASCSLFDSNPVAMSSYIFSIACGSSERSYFFLDFLHCGFHCSESGGILGLEC